jgi:hypothetical protein
VKASKRVLGVAAAVAVIVLGLSVSAPTRVAATDAVAVSSPVIVPTHAKAPAGGTVDIGAGVEPDNRNAQLAETIPSSIRLKWSNPSENCITGQHDPATSVAITQHRTVFIGQGYWCSTVYSLDNMSGQPEWANRVMTADGNLKAVGNTVYFEGVSTVHTAAVTPSQPVQAWSVVPSNPGNGAPLLWTTTDDDKDGGPVVNGRGFFTNSVNDGLVSLGTSVVSATTGKHVVTLPLGPTATPGTPSSNEAAGVEGGQAFIAGNRIFYNSDADIEAFSLTGRHLWTHVKSGGTNGAGFGHTTPALNNGLLYIESTTGSRGQTLVLNASTGAFVRTLQGSTQPWAIDGNWGFFTSPAASTTPGAISAVSLTTGHIAWTHTVAPLAGHPADIASPPVIENGLIWFQTGYPGQLVSISEVTGTTKSTTQQQCAPSGAEIAIAQHRIATPTWCGLFTYVGN